MERANPHMPVLKQAEETEKKEGREGDNRHNKDKRKQHDEKLSV